MKSFKVILGFLKKTYFLSFLRGSGRSSVQPKLVCELRIKLKNN